MSHSLYLDYVIQNDIMTYIPLDTFSILRVTTFIQHMTQTKWWATMFIQHTSSNYNTRVFLLIIIKVKLHDQPLPASHVWKSASLNVKAFKLFSFHSIRYFCETLQDFQDPCPVNDALRTKIVTRLTKEGSNANEPANIALSDYSSLRCDQWHTPFSLHFITTLQYTDCYQARHHSVSYCLIKKKK